MNDDTSKAVHAETRRLAAIMFTDIVGFSRQMGSNETRTLRLLDTHNQLIRKSVTEHHGTVIKTVGDAFLVDFPSVVHAVQCAQDIQAQLHAYNAEHEPAEQIHVRIGIHLGDIVQKDGDVFGDGVNVAKRLQELAEPDTICLSDVVYRDVAKKLDVGTAVSLGWPKLKNIAEQFHVYALLPEQPTGFRQHLRAQRLKLTHWRRPVQVAAVLLVLGWVGVVTHRVLFPSPSPRQPQRGASTDSQPLPLPDKPSIVVLPFVNLSNDPEQEYFSDGITEDLTSDLSKISSLFVISRNTAFTYKGKAMKVQEVSKELGVRYVLEGSVRKLGDRVRITAQLVDAPRDYHLWSERYDRPLQELFAVQDELRQKIVTTLKLQVTLSEQGILVRGRSDNLEAYDFFLRGQELFWRLTKEANTQARQMFEKATELDPKYAAAYAGISWTYLSDMLFQWSQDPQTLVRAFELAQKAVTLDDSLPGAHMVLGMAYLYKKQQDQAIAEEERAIALNPNNADSYRMLADVLNAAGRSEEALGLLEKAIRLNPRYPAVYLNSLDWAYVLTGRYEQAITALKKAVSRNPNLLGAYYGLAVSYSELGRDEEAQAEVTNILRITPSASLEGVRRGLFYKDPVVLERHLAALRKAGLK